MALDFFERLKRNVAAHPEEPAIVNLGSDRKELITYGQIQDEVKKISVFLRNSGVTAGSKVGILMENHPRWGLAFLAGQSAGATIVPLDVLHQPDTLAYLVDHSECEFLFCSEKQLPTLEQIQSTRPEPLPAVVIGSSGNQYREWNQLLEQANHDDAPLPLVVRDLDEPHIIMYTSGTTGNPKGVVLSGRNLYQNIDAALKQVDIGSDDNFLGVLPLYHILALIVNFMAPLYNGARATYLDVLDAQRILKAFREEGITVFVCVPQFYYLLHRRIRQEIARQSWWKRFLFNRLYSLSRTCNRNLNRNPGGYFFSAIHKQFGPQFRLFGAGGARFDPEVVESLNNLGFTLAQAYGMTETAALATMTRGGIEGLGSVGRALPHVEIRISNPNAKGQGEVLIRGENVMLEYFKNPKATAEAIDSDSWLHSGDLGYLDEDGFLYITGRAKDVIVLSSGKNIYPEEIEHFYEQRCQYMKEMCVLGVVDSSTSGGQESLHAIVVPDFEYLKSQQVVNIYDMIRYWIENLSQQLPPHKRVHSFEIRSDPLPRTTTRKIKRFALEQSLEPAPEPGTPDSSKDWSPESELAKSVVNLIHRIKPGVVVRPEMSLELDLGFDSLERVELMSGLRDTLQVGIHDEEAAELFTVQDVIQAVEVTGGNDMAGPGIGERKSWAAILSEPLSKEDEARVTERLRRRAFVEFLFVLVAKITLFLARILFQLRGEGLENLPKQYPFMICPNHLSFLDAFVVVALLPSRVVKRFFSLGYADYFSSGIVSFLGKLIKTIPVDPDRTLRQALRLAAHGLKSNLVLCVFPEGERSIDGHLKTFRKGPAILATNLRVPVVPVAIKGSYEAWRRGSGSIRLHPIRIKFGPPIEARAGESIDEFNDRLKQAVLEQLAHLSHKFV
jgi:long-chain acyl-CoA synthetase